MKNIKNRTGDRLLYTMTAVKKNNRRAKWGWVIKRASVFESTMESSIPQIASIARWGRLPDSLGAVALKKLTLGMAFQTPPVRIFSCRRDMRSSWKGSLRAVNV